MFLLNHHVVTMFFSRNLRHTGRGFAMLLYKAQEYAFKNDDKTFKNKLIREYHAECQEQEKREILEEFRKEDSTVRLLLSTVAFGMGIDIPDVSLIIHWGESDTLSQYWQEVGRAGRDGRQSEAHLYHRQIQVIRCQEEVKQFVKNVTEGQCMRSLILRALTVKGMKQPELVQKDSCCSICSGT